MPGRLLHEAVSHASPDAVVRGPASSYLKRHLRRVPLSRSTFSGDCQLLDGERGVQGLVRFDSNGVVGNVAGITRKGVSVGLEAKGKNA